MAARWLALSIGGVPALATVLAFGGAWSWQLDLLSHFRTQFAVILAIMVVLMMFMRQWRLGLLVMLPLAVNVALILPLYVHPKWFTPHPEFLSQQSQPGESLKLMSYNMGSVFEGNDDPFELIRNSSADVIVLQDVRPKMLEQLAYAVAPFRVYISDARTDGYGVALLNRVSLGPQVIIEDADLIHLSGSGNAKPVNAIEATLLWQGRTIRLLTLKAIAPLDFQAGVSHARQFEAMASWANAQDYPVVIVGDLSASPWSYAFTQLLKKTGLMNSQLGFGLQGSWPATGGALGQIAVDHCLIDPSLVTIKRSLGPSYQSNHQALMVELRWASGARDAPSRFEIDRDDADMEKTRERWIRSGNGRRRHGAQSQHVEESATQPSSQPTTQTSTPPATQPVH